MNSYFVFSLSSAALQLAHIPLIVIRLLGRRRRREVI